VSGLQIWSPDPDQIRLGGGLHSATALIQCVDMAKHIIKLVLLPDIIISHHSFLFLPNIVDHKVGWSHPQREHTLWSMKICYLRVRLICRYMFPLETIQDIDILSIQSSQRPDMSAKAQWFTYLLSALVCFRSTPGSRCSFNRRYCNVEVFHLRVFVIQKRISYKIWPVLPCTQNHRYICRKIFVKIRSVVFT